MHNTRGHAYLYVADSIKVLTKYGFNHVSTIYLGAIDMCMIICSEC